MPDSLTDYHAKYLAHELTKRCSADSLEKLAGHKIDVLHIVGGGIKNELLNQFAADATGKTVVTGPVEATVLGNVLMQAAATGQLKALAEGRSIVAKSFETKTYQPKDRAGWQAFRKKAKSILKS